MLKIPLSRDSFYPTIYFTNFSSQIYLHYSFLPDLGIQLCHIDNSSPSYHISLVTLDQATINYPRLLSDYRKVHARNLLPRYRKKER